MVLEAGKVVEQGRPADMLENPDGYLARMVAATGDREAAYLTQLARGVCPGTPQCSLRRLPEEEYPNADTGSNDSNPFVQSPMGSQHSSSSWVDVDQSPTKR